MTISHGGKPLQRTAVLNEVRQPHKSLKDAFQWIFEAIEKEPVLAIALAAMLITCIFVPVDAEYLGYFNWPTLATLYCTLVVVEALSTFMFLRLSVVGLSCSSKPRNATIGLVCITFVVPCFLPTIWPCSLFYPWAIFIEQNREQASDGFYVYHAEHRCQSWRNGDSLRQSAELVSLRLFQHRYAGIHANHAAQLLGIDCADLGLCFFVKPEPLELKKIHNTAWMSA